MAYLIDTNVLLRFVQHSEPQHPEVRAALINLRQQGEKLCLTPQTLVEFRGGGLEVPAIGSLDADPRHDGR